jgi:hypothetical protein
MRNVQYECIVPFRLAVFKFSSKQMSLKSILSEINPGVGGNDEWRSPNDPLIPNEPDASAFVWSLGH